MSASYGWIITKDHISGPAVGEPENLSDVGTIGPSNVSDDMMLRLRNGDGNRFRMYDDDGFLYYEGRYIGDIGWDGDPVTDFGGPNAGCTYMMEPTGENGKWEITIG